VATKRDLEALEQRLRADVRAEINSAITTALTSQTRTIMFSVIASTPTMASVAFAAASWR
jgi:hypothetical protein